MANKTVDRICDILLLIVAVLCFSMMVGYFYTDHGTPAPPCVTKECKDRATPHTDPLYWLYFL